MTDQGNQSIYCRVEANNFLGQSSLQAINHEKAQSLSIVRPFKFDQKIMIHTHTKQTCKILYIKCFIQTTSIQILCVQIHNNCPSTRSVVCIAIYLTNTRDDYAATRRYQRHTRPKLTQASCTHNSAQAPPTTRHRHCLH